MSTTAPQDGRGIRAGYANMKLVTQRKAFRRIKYLDTEYYDAIILRIRGDGRSYHFNIHTREFFDIHWMDLYSYPLYTRGGPYWQDVVIPFSKFFLSARGFIQDSQQTFDREKVTNVSISLMDQISGPFHLEIESIGMKKLEGPDRLREKLAYETYKLPNTLYVGSHL